MSGSAHVLPLKRSPLPHSTTPSQSQGHQAPDFLPFLSEFTQYPSFSFPPDPLFFSSHDKDPTFLPPNPLSYSQQTPPASIPPDTAYASSPLDTKDTTLISSEIPSIEDSETEFSTDSVLEAFKLAQSNTPETGSVPSVQSPYAYNQLMKSFSRIGNSEEVLHLFTGMKQSKCNPNVLCYNTVINCLVISNRAEEAQAVFDEMILSGISPDVSSFNILVKLYSWYSKQFDLAYKVLENMNRFGFSPDSTTYSTIITGLCRAGRIDEAWGVLDWMLEEKCTPTVRDYTPIVQGYCSQGKVEEAKELVSTMEGVGSVPNTVTYNILIAAFCKIGRFDEVEKILKESKVKGWKPDSVTYNTYMNGLCKRGMVKEALNQLEILLRESITPTVVTLSILIDCLCRDSNISGVKHLLEKNPSLIRHVIGYNVLMSRLCERGEWRFVLKLMVDMIKRGIKPNTRTLNIIVSSLCVGGKSGLAKALINSRGFARNVVAYNTILHWLFLEGKFSEAWALISEMEIDEIAPDVVTYGVLINGFVREGKYSEATNCFLKLMESGVSVDRGYVLIDKLVRYRKFREILDMFRQMDGVNLDTRMFDLVIRAFCRHGVCCTEDGFTLCLVLDKMLTMM